MKFLVTGDFLTKPFSALLVRAFLGLLLFYWLAFWLNAALKVEFSFTGFIAYYFTPETRVGWAAVVEDIHIALFLNGLFLMLLLALWSRIYNNQNSVTIIWTLFALLFIYEGGKLLAMLFPALGYIVVVAGVLLLVGGIGLLSLTWVGLNRSNRAGATN